MYNNLPPLKTLRAFEATARHMSFSFAAKELFVTQSAVSHQVRNLEQFLGKKLFVRQGKLLSLSSAGLAYFPVIQRIFNILDVTSAKTMGRSSGITRLAVHSSFALKWLVPRLPEFRILYPHIDLRISMVTNIEVDLDLLGVDCAISIRNDNPQYHFNHLQSEEWFPICSPQLYETFERLPLAEALLSFPLLDGGYQNEWLRLFDRLQLALPQDHEMHYFSHVILLQQAAIEGQGIALSTSVLADADIQAGRLMRIPLTLKENPELFTHFYFCCQKARRNETDIVALESWLKQEFTQ